MWAQVRQVLWKENVPPQVSAKLYKAIVQSVLLYRSKTWVLSAAVLARLKGFHILVWHIGCQGCTYLVGGCITNGFTHPRIKCWKSVGCTPFSTTSMCRGRRSHGTWSNAASLLNARGQTEGAVWCPGGGGGSRRCVWMMFDATGSCN